MAHSVLTRSFSLHVDQCIGTLLTEKTECAVVQTLAHCTLQPLGPKAMLSDPLDNRPQWRQSRTADALTPTLIPVDWICLDSLVL